MKGGWQAVFDFLKYNRKDRLGLLILAFVTLGVWLLPYVLPEPARLEYTWAPVNEPLPIDPFPFAVDTVTVEQLTAMGLGSRPAQNLVRYRNKGGKITSKEKLLAIYGMDTTWWDQWHPMARFQGDERMEPSRPRLQTEKARPFAAAMPDSASLRALGLSGGQIKAWNDIARRNGRIDSLAFAQWGFLSEDQKERVRPFVAFDPVLRMQPNTAGAEEWKALPGVGEKTAQRLVDYRANLGGFVSIWQLAEVGLDSGRIQSLQPYLNGGWGVQHKLRINHLGVDELARHPYIRTSGAKRLVSYRETVGQLKSAQEVGKVLLLDPGKLEKLTPYLSFE